MAISQKRSKRKISGGRYRPFRKEKLRDTGRDPTFTKLGDNKVRKFRIRAGNEKRVLLSANVINVYDSKEKKYKKVKIKSVLENPANRHYVRRGILTKGTIVDTEAGKARITSRPGQEGVLSGVLVK